MKRRRTSSPFKPRSYASLSRSLPDASLVINISLLGAIGFGGYKLYKMFGDSPNDSANDANAKEAALTKTSVNSSQSKKLQDLEKQLNSRNLYIQSSHRSSADYLYGLLNTPLVDQSKIVSTIKGMAFQTLQLVAVSYGTRNLSVYINHHIFNGNSWSLDNLFSSEKSIGDLRSHLEIVLSDSNLSKISSLTKYI